MPLADDLDLTSLRLLVAVAESGSLGRAAARLAMTQPAASQRMRNLERRLGLTLLTRTTSGSTLTAAGASVVDWARPVLDAVEVLARSVEALHDGRDQRLRVAASLTVADHLVPGWLVAYHRERPGSAVALQVVNSDGVAELVRDGAVDLGFVEGVGAPRGLRSAVVGEDSLVVVVAPAHRWAGRQDPLPAAELAAEPLVLREQGSGTREALERVLRARGLGPRSALELGSTTAIRAAVVAGEGPAVLSELAVRADVDAGVLVAVAADLPLRRRFRAVWRSHAEPAGPAATLLAVALRSGRPQLTRPAAT
ncbi:MAG: LysR family transcriptional regulator [Motilibacteraceae bacterium]